MSVWLGIFIGSTIGGLIPEMGCQRVLLHIGVVQWHRCACRVVGRAQARQLTLTFVGAGARTIASNGPALSSRAARDTGLGGCLACNAGHAAPDLQIYSRQLWWWSARQTLLRRLSRTGRLFSCRTVRRSSHCGRGATSQAQTHHRPWQSIPLDQKSLRERCPAAVDLARVARCAS
jgi:hypothetical protein